ncbi:MAG: hypothetical protein JO316_16870 [Abitibacteriaceae bacterium]|nr:hypothetical protein [Abditibacteriaceae bacterium]MBV9867028.1 hypothetical protein [Abditibacteriaceae bacterium]
MKSSELAKSVKVEITYQHYIALQMIDLHDFSLVKKKVAQEHGIKDAKHLDTGILYLKRYYAIHILDPLNPPAMSLPVDPFWHTHVLYSEDYIGFCNQVFGQYIHHIPLLFEDKVAVAFVTDMYNHTYKRHEEIFGKIDERFFPRDATIGLCCSPKSGSRLEGFVDVALFPEDKLMRLLPSSV